MIFPKKGLKDSASTVIASKKTDEEIKKITSRIDAVETNVDTLKSDVELADITLNSKIDSLTNTVSDVNKELSDDITTVQNNLDSYKETEAVSTTSASATFTDLTAKNAVLENVETNNLKLKAFGTGKAYTIAKGSVVKAVKDNKAVTVIYQDTDKYIAICNGTGFALDDGILHSDEQFDIYFIGDEPEVYSGTVTTVNTLSDGISLVGDVDWSSDEWTLKKLNAEEETVTDSTIENATVTNLTSLSVEANALKSNGLQLKDHIKLLPLQTTEDYIVTLPQFSGTYFLELYKDTEKVLAMTVSCLAGEYISIQYGMTSRLYFKKAALVDGKVTFTTSACGDLYYGFISDKQIASPETEIGLDSVLDPYDPYIIQNKAGMLVLKGQIDCAESPEGETGNLPVGMIVMATDSTTLSDISELGGTWEEIEIDGE